MQFVATTVRRSLAALLCVALLVWSIMPVTSHTPSVLETLQDHAEMVAEHGHSHGIEEDLAWAIHGHGHDSADHDHSPMILAALRQIGASTSYGSIRLADMSTSGPWPVRLLDRPPRA